MSKEEFPKLIMISLSAERKRERSTEFLDDDNWFKTFKNRKQEVNSFYLSKEMLSRVLSKIASFEKLH